jgi:hypothetical protein
MQKNIQQNSMPSYDLKKKKSLHILGKEGQVPMAHACNPT